MSELSHLVAVDTNEPIVNREQIEMLQMVDDEDGSGEGSLVAELFALFQEEAKEALGKLPAICAQNNLAELRKIVHFVAGSAGNIGLHRLNHYYRNIEETIDTGKLQDLSGADAPILEAYEASVDYMRKQSF